MTDEQMRCSNCGGSGRVFAQYRGADWSDGWSGYKTCGSCYGSGTRPTPMIPAPPEPARHYPTVVTLADGISHPPVE